MRTTERLQKNVYKILLVITSLLVICAVVITSFSFARYVTLYGELNGGNVAGISCSFVVDGKKSTFVNAPFLQRVSENAEAVQMNAYSETVITVNNKNDETSRDYSYSFIMYIPERFAENMMFQFVELSGDASSLAVESDAVKASELYQIHPDSHNCIRNAVIEGIGDKEVPNDYRQLIDGEGGKLELSMHAEKEDEPRKGILLSTYTSYRTEVYGDVEVESLMCSVTTRREQQFNYYKLTVNLPVTDDYLLDKGASKSFLFRCVPSSALPSSEYETNVWNPALYDKSIQPAVPDGFICRWNDAGSGLQASQDGGASWFDINPKDCVGLSSPSRINVVFTQQN